jgi:thiol:disulfide interchange protein DsbC
MYKFVTSILVAITMVHATAVNSKEPSKEIVAGIKNLAPTAKVSSMESTPVEGISEIVIETGRGGEVYYISNDGKYLLNGNMIETASRQDLTENKKSGIRKDIVAKFGQSERIDFFPDEMKHHLTVFTDIDCGYCRKLHNQIDEYNALGIGISYLFFPRAGLKSPSYDKAVTVWCSDNKQEALTSAKTGITLENKTCDNPIEKQYMAGQAAGVTGTPALVLDNGKLMPGYLPPDALLQRLTSLSAQ